MSAPDTNIEKQKKRHRPPLIGIASAVIFGVGMLIILGFFVLGNADDETAIIEPVGTVGTTGTVNEGTSDSN